jgi:hypothetical protein
MSSRIAVDICGDRRHNPPALPSGDIAQTRCDGGAARFTVDAGAGILGGGWL